MGVRWILVCLALMWVCWGVLVLSAVPTEGFEESRTDRFELAVIDRVEEGLAVLLIGDKEEERLWPVTDLPHGARPGSWLKVRWHGERLVEARLAPEETEMARRRVEAKLEQLRRRGRRLD